ncbi:MAG: COX15/CtaA family protein [Planctomycetes bacterium]|nr:COX15/CtaA family protein [Planctomycetota bacterium]
MTSTTVPLAATPSTRGPFRLAIGVLAVTALTVVKGAMTTSTGSGLAFRDWPTSDGGFMPERSLTTVPGFLEHFHRLAGGTVGLLSLALALWLHFGRLGDRRVRACAWFGGCFVLAQGLVGGTHVLKGLPVLTGVVHATFAQLIFATFAWIAYQLTDRHRTTAPVTTAAPGAGRRIAMTALAILVVQTVFGAVARHSNSAHALWTHVGNSFVVFVIGTIATAFATGKLGQIPGIRPLANWIVGLLVLQIALGFVVLAIRPAQGKQPENVANLTTASVISLHVLIGASLTMLVALLAAHVFRGTRRAGPQDAVA